MCMVRVKRCTWPGKFYNRRALAVTIFLFELLASPNSMEREENT